MSNGSSLESRFFWDDENELKTSSLVNGFGKGAKRNGLYLTLALLTASTVLCAEGTQYEISEFPADNAVYSSMYPLNYRKKISLKEASRIAERTFLRAEKAREELRDYEARIGIHWGDNSDL